MQGPLATAIYLWWFLCLGLYVLLVIAFLVQPTAATGWLYVKDASPKAIVELNAFYLGNMTLVVVLLWRWRRAARRWLSLLMALNGLVMIYRCLLLVFFPETVDARMLSYLGTEFVVAAVSGFLRYRSA
jgi:xanthine/uracil permease